MSILTLNDAKAAIPSEHDNISSSLALDPSATAAHLAALTMTLSIANAPNTTRNANMYTMAEINVRMAPLAVKQQSVNATLATAANVSPSAAALVPSVDERDTTLASAHTGAKPGKALNDAYADADADERCAVMARRMAPYDAHITVAMLMISTSSNGTPLAPRRARTKSLTTINVVTPTTSVRALSSADARMVMMRARRGSRRRTVRHFATRDFFFGGDVCHRSRERQGGGVRAIACEWGVL
jgi:hypothetical protein